MQLAQMLGEAKDELDALKQNNNDLRGAMINAIKVGVMFDACLVHRFFLFFFWKDAQWLRTQIFFK